MAADPNRFQLYHESMAATVARTGGIALVIASILTIRYLHHLPASAGQWRGWVVLVLSVGWLSFGGHWVELAYLNRLRPKIAHWSDGRLILVRIAIWIVGGTILVLCAIITQNLLSFGTWPPQRQLLHALLYGGPLFTVVELFPHTFLLFARRPSFWNCRG